MLKNIQNSHEKSLINIDKKLEKLELLESTFSSAFKSLTVELTAVKNEQVPLLANFDTLKIRFETLENALIHW